MQGYRFWVWLGRLFRYVFCISLLSFSCPYCIKFGALKSSFSGQGWGEWVICLRLPCTRGAHQIRGKMQEG